MTQLDLPQISLARYVDLLKRRRWQVVPVSLLGLGVGALVAFFIPRYYVARTDVRYNAEQLLSPQQRSIDDPLTELLASAKILIPAQIPAVLKELGWPEAAVADEDARAAFEAEVRSRVDIIDLGPAGKQRQNTHLRIGYRDTDGSRVAKFANALRERWVSQQLREVEQASIVEGDLLREERRTLLDEVDFIAQEILTFERQHELDPSLGGNVEPVGKLVVLELAELQRRDEELSLELARLEAQLAGAEQRLADGMPKTIRRKVPPPTDPIQLAKLQTLSIQILQLQTLLGLITDQHERHASATLQLETKRAELAKLAPLDAEEVVPNPDYLALQQSHDDTQRLIHETLSVQQPLRARIKQLRVRLATLPGLSVEYKEKRQRETAARARLSENDANLRRAEGRRRQIVESKPFSVLYEARTPPRPTDPNPTVLALVGSLIGLGVAIGLILLLDAMRFTFKTMQDLEHGLTVPVLGGVSHLETVDERVGTRRNRILVTVTASVILALLVIVVTIYYVAPARLPGFVFDVFELLLGTGG